MAKRGVFFWPGLRRVSISVLVFALWPVALMVTLNIQDSIDGWDWEIFWLGQLGYTGVMTVVYLASMAFGRGQIQQSTYSAFLAQASPRGDRQHRTRRRQELSHLPMSDVAHVLCATELTSGQPFYMSRAMVLSPVYGRGTPDISLSRAVYASAAFPIGFPPLRLRSNKLNLTGGQDDEPPKQLLLSDGGVFNNLGTETFSAESSAHIFLPDPSLPIIPPVGRQLVVNASSPPKKTALSRVPIWRSIACSARIMSVMYENTLRPRVQRLTEDQLKQDGPIVIDISESPIELTVRLSNGRSETDLIRTRAMGMRGVLGQDRSDNDWKSYAERAARTKTVLSPVGRTAAIRLVRLGYLDTAIACHAHLGTQGINFVPNDKGFSDLVDNRRSDDQLVAPIAGYQADRGRVAPGG
jgi:predicted acylesterase/phospholipase RssA